MRSDIVALAGTLLLAGGCASTTATTHSRARSAIERKDSIAQTLVERTLQSFREVNQQGHHRLRTYEEILRAAEQHGYRMFDWNTVGSGPSVVVIGWEHAPTGIYTDTVTPSVKNGLQIILDTYERGDVLLPEGYGSGERVGIAEIYKPWADMAQFLVENRSRLPDAARRKINGTPVFFVGSDTISNSIPKMFELHYLWIGVQIKKWLGDEEEGMPLLSAYLDKSTRYFPNLTEEERLNFGAVFDRYLEYVQCEGSDERELEYLLPTIMGLARAKNPHQLVYVTRGAGHIYRRKLLERLKEEGIGFVALAPEDTTVYVPQCD